jgi:hypothetical protein
VISDAHTGLKAAIARVFDATWQRCRVHWIRNALAHVPKGQHTVVAAAIRQAFNQPDHDGASLTWRHVADQLRGRWPKLATLMDESEADVLAYMSFPSQHRTKLHSTNPLERLNKELKRRANVVGIVPDEEVIIRLIDAVLFEQNDDLAGPAPLHAGGGFRADRRRPIRPASKHHYRGRLTDAHHRPHRKFHQLDGRDRSPRIAPRRTPRSASAGNSSPQTLQKQLTAQATTRQFPPV